MEEVHPDGTELLIRLLARHQEELFRYIFALMPHEEDARDVLQETSVALFRKFAEYDPAKPFLAWAYRFAYVENPQAARAQSPRPAPSEPRCHRTSRAGACRP